MTKNTLNGWLILDKPLGPTSNQCLSKLKRIFRPVKIGFVGTLDPLASGVLPIAFGEATKVIPYIEDQDKTYTFTILWGAFTTTDDAEGDVTAENPKRPSDVEIKKIIPQFIGEIEQIPPVYSAIKIDGQPAYKRVRRGEDVEMKPRRVTIHDLQLLGADSPDSARFLVNCSKGTYVRTLARDIATALGTAGHITALRRTKVGKITEKQAISLETLDKMGYSPPALKHLLPLTTGLDDIPVMPISLEMARRLRMGQNQRLETAPQTSGAVLVMCEQEPVGFADVVGGELKPRRLFNI